MPESTTTTAPPAWFNLNAVLPAETVEELNSLADDVEQVIADFEARLAERCFRALLAVEAAGQAMDGGDETFAVLTRWSGSRRLQDALYALANAAAAANLERPEPEPAWFSRVRADLGLNEWGVSER